MDCHCKLGNSPKAVFVPETVSRWCAETLKGTVQLNLLILTHFGLRLQSKWKRNLPKKTKNKIKAHKVKFHWFDATPLKAQKCLHPYNKHRGMETYSDNIVKIILSCKKIHELGLAIPVYPNFFTKLTKWAPDYPVHNRLL